MDWIAPCLLAYVPSSARSLTTHEKVTNSRYGVLSLTPRSGVCRPEHREGSMPSTFDILCASQHSRPAIPCSTLPIPPYGSLPSPKRAVVNKSGEQRECGADQRDVTKPFLTLIRQERAD